MSINATGIRGNYRIKRQNFDLQGVANNNLPKVHYKNAQ